MAYRAQFEENRRFGVEIEAYGATRALIAYALRLSGIDVVESYKNSPTIDRWKIVEDESIRGPNPFELVSPPLQGERGLQEVTAVLTALNLLRCEVNYTCGFHVHWEVADFNGKNILSLLRLYAKFENVIDYLVAPSRRANRNSYCQSMVKEGGIHWVSELVPNEHSEARAVAQEFQRKHANRNYRREDRYNNSRKHKVNVTAYLQHKTVEFRQHQGTLEKEKAINWIIFTQQFVNKAKYVAVSAEPSSKPTLGEMLRALGLVDHMFMREHCTDVRILELPGWLKGRYKHFRSQESREQQ